MPPIDRHNGITPFETDDGSDSLKSDLFGDTYHSKHGAVQESKHIYIENGLKNVLAQSDDGISILEYGFGTGLNAALTWSEVMINHSDSMVSYIGLEGYPISKDQAMGLNYQAFLPGIDFQLLHQVKWNKPHQLAPNFRFVKEAVFFEKYVSPQKFHLIYYDAFGPPSQPDFWKKNHLQKVISCLRPGGVLVTYCAQGAFRRVLNDLSMDVERLPGPPGKWEMIRATRSF